MKKYSLKWWFEFGKMGKNQGSKNKRVAKKLISHIAYTLGHWVA